MPTNTHCSSVSPRAREHATSRTPSLTKNCSGFTSDVPPMMTSRCSASESSCAARSCAREKHKAGEPDDHLSAQTQGVHTACRTPKPAQASHWTDHASQRAPRCTRRAPRKRSPASSPWAPPPPPPPRAVPCSARDGPSWRTPPGSPWRPAPPPAATPRSSWAGSRRGTALGSASRSPAACSAPAA